MKTPNEYLYNRQLDELKSAAQQLADFCDHRVTLFVPYYGERMESAPSMRDCVVLPKGDKK